MCNSIDNYQIGQLMANQPGWNEISLPAQHRIKSDIAGRFGQIAAFYSSAEDFVENYVNWVTNLIGGHNTQPADMWEDWDMLLRKLYLPV